MVAGFEVLVFVSSCSTSASILERRCCMSLQPCSTWVCVNLPLPSECFYLIDRCWTMLWVPSPAIQNVVKPCGCESMRLQNRMLAHHGCIGPQRPEEACILHPPPPLLPVALHRSNTWSLLRRISNLTCLATLTASMAGLEM